MEVVSLTAKEIVATVEFTEKELDQLSLALSKCALDPIINNEGKAAYDTLVKFSTLINDLLTAMENRNGRN